MIKYYLDFQGFSEGMFIREYNTDNGVVQFGKSVLIYNRTLSVERLYDTIEEAIKSLKGYSKKTILPSGKEIIPCYVNYGM